MEPVWVTACLKAGMQCSKIEETTSSTVMRNAVVNPPRIPPLVSLHKKLKCRSDG